MTMDYPIEMLEAAYPALAWLRHDHLPPHLAQVAAPFRELGLEMAYVNNMGHPETAAGIRKLVEAKDCAIRAFIGTHPQ